MREVADESRIRRFMAAVAKEANSEGRLYFTGGASAVLIGWRSTTIDVDIKLVPESDAVLRAIPALKDALRINVELAAPDQFLPPLPGWEDRSIFIEQKGRLAFYHYDFYAQALGKMERRHHMDVDDVQAMFQKGLVTTNRVLEFLEQIEPYLYRYPAVDPASFRQSVEELTKKYG